MRRDLLFVVVGLVAMVAVGIGGLTLLDYLSEPGESPRPSPLATLAPAVPPTGAPAGPQAWAEALRADGYEVTHGAVTTLGNVTTVADVTLAGLADSFRWRLSSAQVQIQRGDGGRWILQLSGAHSLTLPIDGAEQTFGFTARGLQIDLLRNNAGRVTRLAVNATELAIALPGGGEAAQANRVQLQLQRSGGAGAIPERSSLTAQVEKLALPALSVGALGRTLEALAAEVEFDRGLPSLKLGAELPAWRAAPNGRLTVKSARFNWGMLNFEATGTLGLDAAWRPDGTLKARIRNLVPALDAFHVFRPLDAAARAAFYAALLDDLGRGAGDPADMALILRGGAARLARDGLGELGLGALPPLLPLPQAP